MMKTNRLLYLVNLFGLLLCLFSCGKHTIEDIPETPIGFYDSNPQCFSQCFSDQAGGAQVPASHYLNNVPSGKDQGPLGTCVSFAMSTCAEYIHGQPFSEAEFNVLVQTHNLGNKCRDGLFLGKALLVANQFGLVEAPRLTYQPYVEYVAEKNGIDISAPNWKAKLLDESDETSLEVCEVGDYNTTMMDIGVNLMLTGYTSQDATKYKLKPLYPICHIPKKAINQRVQGLINSNRLQRIPRYRLTSDNTHTTTSRSLHYINNPSRGTTLTYRNQLPSVPSNISDTASSSNQVVTRGYVNQGRENTLTCIERALANDYPVIMAITIYNDGSWDSPDVKKMALR